jgi:exonuclease III
MLKFTQKTVFSIFILFSTFGKISAQNNDTIQVQETKQDSIVELNTETNHLNYKRLIVPTALIGYGVASLSVKGIKQLNFSTRDEINENTNRITSDWIITPNLLLLLWFMD